MEIQHDIEASELDDVIRLAREVGFKVGTNISGVQLVGAPMEIGLAHLTVEELALFYKATFKAGAREAQERCAEFCDEWDEPGSNPGDIADVIRMWEFWK